MRQTFPAFLLLVLLCACVSPTSAVVVSVGTGAATTCQISTGWSSKELRERCGAPTETHEWRGHPEGECWTYSTTYSPAGDGRGPRGYLVCLRAPSERSGGERTVDSVWPLSSR